MKILVQTVGVALALTLASVPDARANLVEYYVGLDTGTGTNNGHLTLLKAHGDHFHRLGVFGGAEGRIPEQGLRIELRGSFRQIPMDFAGRRHPKPIISILRQDYVRNEIRQFRGNALFSECCVKKSMRKPCIPEAYIGGYLSLQEGMGAFQGRYVSREYQTPGSEVGEYSDLEIRPISTLLGFAAGTPEAILANGGLRYLGPLDGTSLALELVSLTPGLHVADQVGNPILSAAGDRYILGAGNSFAAFTPMFHTDVLATVGSLYSAAFRMVDVNGIVPESQIFRYDFVTGVQAVPEPSGLVLMGLGLGVTLLVKMRSRRRSSLVATT